jgi:SpoVK/Ycf46/Vps4 family AAA+-type ATPase
MDTIKQSLRVAIEWPLLYPEAFAMFGLLQPKGMPLWKVFTVSEICSD